jgi:kynurenine 3-monooxygenase
MDDPGRLNPQKVVVVGAGPVGALAALYATKRGDEVHVYELRDGKRPIFKYLRFIIQSLLNSVTTARTFSLAAHRF